MERAMACFLGANDRRHGCVQEPAVGGDGVVRGERTVEEMLAKRRVKTEQRGTHRRRQVSGITGKIASPKERREEREKRPTQQSIALHFCLG